MHGWLDNAASFACLSKHFSTCRVIALEFFGHGHSDHRPAGAVYYLWENVLDLHCALEALDLGMVTLVGHSMGASVAMLYAASFAQRVERLCLIEGLAPLHYCESELPALMANAMKRHLRKRRVTYYDTLDTLIAARAKSKFSLSQEAASALVKRGARVASQGVCWRSDPALLNPSVQRFSKAQVMHFLAAVNVPVLLILGDEGIETTHWQAYYTQLTQLEVHRLKG
ncbi:MAG: alpha/beta fold hydrolase, partial [Pseudomonadales bacterium]